VRHKNQMYEVEIKSNALLKEGKKSLITYFRGGNKKTIVNNTRVLYPQYTDPNDKPIVSITPITFREYEERVGGNMIHQKKHLVKAEGEFPI
jgi:hypothetical protein